MSDQQNNSPSHPRPISEISHLFLSSVRDVQTGGASRPVRIPPGGAKPQAGAEDASPAHPAHSIDLSAEEYAQVLAGGDLPAAGRADDVRIPPVTAVIAQHLNGRAHDTRTEYVYHHRPQNVEELAAGRRQADQGYARPPEHAASFETTSVLRANVKKHLPHLVRRVPPAS